MNDDIFDFLDNDSYGCVLDGETAKIIINFLVSKGIGLKTINYKSYTIDFPMGWMFFKIWKSEKEFYIDLRNGLSGKSLRFIKCDVQGIIDGLENIIGDIENIIDDTADDFENEPLEDEGYFDLV